MLNVLRIDFLGGRTGACRPPDGFLTWPVTGEPVLRTTPPSDGLRGGGGGIFCAEPGLSSSTGDSMKLSSKLGVDEHDRPSVATLPNRKGGNCVSALVGRCGTKLVVYALVRDSDGLVTGRLRLVKESANAATGIAKRAHSLTQVTEETTAVRAQPGMPVGLARYLAIADPEKCQCRDLVSILVSAREE